MAITRNMRRVFPGALLPLVVVLASCSGSDSVVDGVPTPSAVPAGAVAVVGDSQITNDEFDKALEAGLSGYDPLSPTTETPEPLDPPKFARCRAAITKRAKGDPDLAGLGGPEFLDSCRQRYEQLRALTLTRLIQDRWIRLESELAGVTVSKQEAEAFIGQIRASWASEPAESRRKFRRAVEASDSSPRELRQRAELAVARQRLSVTASGESEPPSPEDIQAAGKERFDAWRSKTLCAERLLVPECLNGPEAS